MEYKRQGRSKLTLRFKSVATDNVNPDIRRLLPVTVKLLHKSYLADKPYPLYTVQHETSNKKANRTSWLNVERINRGATSNIIQAIRARSAIAVSDGSYLEEKGVGAASWVVSTSDKTSFITAGAISPGNKEIGGYYDFNGNWK